MKRFFAIAFILMLLLAAGCSAPKSADTNYMAAPSEPQEAPRPEGNAVSGGAGFDKGEAGQTSLPDYGGHKVIRTFSVSFETDSFDSDIAAILQSAAELGGYAERSVANGRKPEVYSDPGRYAYLTLRVPAEKVEAFVQGVKGYGTLTSYNENADDVTEAYFDLDTRLGVLRTQLDRLKSILVSTDNLADIIALESAISDVTLQIEQLTTQLRRYDGLISYATVEVTINELRLNEGPAAQTSVWERIDRGFTDTLYGVGTFFVNLFIFFVSALPALVVLGAIAAIAVFIARSGVKRKRIKKEKAAQALADKKEGSDHETKE